LTTINFELEKVFDDFVKRQSVWREEKLLLDKLNILFPEPENKFIPDEKLDQLIETYVTRRNTKKVAKKCKKS